MIKAIVYLLALIAWLAFAVLLLAGPTGGFELSGPLHFEGRCNFWVGKGFLIVTTDSSLCNRLYTLKDHTVKVVVEEKK